MARTCDYDVFLSYNSNDHVQVEALGRHLRAAGLEVFLDRWYLSPGTNWLSALENTLQRCRAVAVCVGAAMGAWQQREHYSALQRQALDASFPVIPVLLPGGAPLMGFLGQNTWVDLSAGAEEPLSVARLIKAIRGEPPGPELEAEGHQALAQVCPYRGLRYFDEAHAPFFFGRSAATQQLERSVTQSALVAVVGDSGSGKSSLVRAGLIPRMRASRDPLWEVATLVPTDRPLHALPGIPPERRQIRASR